MRAIIFSVVREKFDYLIYRPSIKHQMEGWVLKYVIVISAMISFGMLAGCQEGNGGPAVTTERDGTGGC